jgi:large subunit ribosomal protein L25
MLSLVAQSRNILGKKVKDIRLKGLIPAVIYGHGVKSRSITVSEKDFKNIFKQAGESSLIDLKIDDGKPVQVLVHDIQIDPLTNIIQHVDFYQVKTGEKITVEVELKFTGESPAVKELGGVLVTPLNKLKIECLPKDLVHEIEVNISNLKTFEDIIRIKDLTLPASIKVLGSADEVVALVESPRAEEELKALEEKPVEKVEEVEAIKEKPKEEVVSEEK